MVSQADIEELLKLFPEGLTTTQLMKKLNLTRGCINNSTKKLVKRGDIYYKQIILFGNNTTYREFLFFIK